MPGILSHALFGDMVYRKLAQVFLSKIDFLAGNLIPDLSTNKDLSHYYELTGIDGLFIPNLELAKRDLLYSTNSLKLGLFCHIYLDYYFIKDILIPKFIWDTEKNVVTNRINNKTWVIQDFFSQAGLYGFYTKSNQLILKKQLISLISIAAIPKHLPLSGMSNFDSRREQTWLDELNGYLSQNINYSGEIFKIEFLWNFIEKKSDDFVDFFYSAYSNLSEEPNSLN